MSTNVPNLKQIGGGHRKNGQKFVDLMWNDPAAIWWLQQLSFELTKFQQLLNSNHLGSDSSHKLASCNYLSKIIFFNLYLNSMCIHCI